MHEDDSDSEDLELELFLEGIFQKYHHDFRGYARASLKRRLRQAAHELECATLSELQGRVLREPALFATLLRYLTVQVSELFRDPRYWAALRSHVLPVLASYPSLKVWVAGCSTGEEVWSLAVLLKEEGLIDRTMIYATDIFPESLRSAERGIFALDRMAQTTERHRLSGARVSLSEHYTAGYDGAVFDRSLRPHMVFADHSLATDEVFAEVQLISCRNVLIYFQKELQERAVDLFRKSLCRRGFLGLGARETLRFIRGGAAFSEVAHDERIYQRF